MVTETFPFSHRRKLIRNRDEKLPSLVFIDGTNKNIVSEQKKFFKKNPSPPPQKIFLMKCAALNEDRGLDKRESNLHVESFI